MKIKTRKSKAWNLLKIPFPGIVMDEMWLTFGKTIWCPESGITLDLIEHEKVHIGQQKNFFIAIFWWVRYYLSKSFRYSQELPAYKKQYQFIKSEYKDKNVQFKFRMRIAEIISGAQYNHMVDRQTAYEDLEK